MEVYYQGTDITNMVEVTACKVHDTAGKSDSLEIEFSNAAGWYSWGPEEDDTIIVSHNGYDSGIMYVNRILPEEGYYRILAASLPCSARAKANKSFKGRTLAQIMKICAAGCGMEYALYGMNEDVVIPYIEQSDEGCASFLNKLLCLEGGVLKCVNGKLTAIGILYAQELKARQTVEIAADQEGVRYARSGETLRSITVKNPFVQVTARDSAVSTKHRQLTVNLPALTSVQAGRWATGKLLSENRKCESVVMKTAFNPSFTAMTRVDISGNTDAVGEWLVDDVEHDLFNLSTSVTMRRCIWTVGL